MPKSKQATLLPVPDADIPKLDFKVSNGLRQPPVWISRLEIWASLDDEEPIRAIDLKQGLNIVWAMDVPPEGQDVAGPPKAITGHCAGKTLFTRLLRYCLGEKTYASRKLQDAIQDSFPEGYVLAQVHIQGTSWAVAKPFGIRQPEFAAPDISLIDLRKQHPPKNSYENAFKPALMNLMEGLPVGLLPGKKKIPIDWDLVLAWATRDQYCHFESIQKWRDKRSNAPFPSFDKSKEDADFLMRLFLGFVLGEEVGKEEDLAVAEAELRRLDGEITEKKREPEFLRRKSKRELHALLGESVDMVIPFDADDLFTRTYDRRISDQEKALGPECRAIEQAIEYLLLERNDIGKSHYENGREIETQDDLLNFAGLEYQEMDRTLKELDKTMAPFVGWRQKQCDIAKRPFERCEYVVARYEEVRRRDARDHPLTEQELQNRQQKIEDIRSSLEILHQEKGRLDRRVEEIDKKVKSLGNEISAKQDRIVRMQESLNELRRWDAIVNDGTAYEPLDKLRQELEAQKTKKASLSEEIAQIRDRQTERFKRFQKLFDILCKNVVGPSVEGLLTNKDSDGLVVDLRQHSLFESPGIDPLKIVLFDLAAMIFSLETGAHFPGFLIHDSPRESDLGWSLYSSLLRVASRLEGAFQNGGGCPFQYIITTTTMPPKELSESPTCIAKFDASKAEGKLFRRDFG